MAEATDSFQHAVATAGGMNKPIQVLGAREHNLRGVDVVVPKNSVVAFTGVSGSGKSSLVFDTIYKEAQRQLIDSFRNAMKAKLPKIPRPDVDEINYLTTPILVDQKRMGANARSIVGTASGAMNYLRLLYSRVAQPQLCSSAYSFNVPDGMCQDCKGIGSRIEIDLDLLLDCSKSLEDGGVKHNQFRPGGWYFPAMRACGLYDVKKKLSKFTKSELDALLHTEEFKLKKSGMTAEGWVPKSFEGIARMMERRVLGAAAGEERTGEHGDMRYFRNVQCSSCQGERLRPEARAAVLAGKRLPELMVMELVDLIAWLDASVDRDDAIAGPVMTRLMPRLEVLRDIGLSYMSLDRPVSTLSGGESQRIKLARQLHIDLVGLTYVLDEPSSGLHRHDIDQAIVLMRNLVNLGNSVLVVEHDPAIIASADHVVELGPGAGMHGGSIVFTGRPADLRAQDTPTGRVLAMEATPEQFADFKRRPVSMPALDDQTAGDSDAGDAALTERRRERRGGGKAKQAVATRGKRRRALTRAAPARKRLRDDKGDVVPIAPRRSSRRATSAVVSYGDGDEDDDGDDRIDNNNDDDDDDDAASVASSSSSDNEDNADDAESDDEQVVHDAGYVTIRNATLHNLLDVSVRIPMRRLVLVTGVSGSGKSSLIHGVFMRQYPQAQLIDQSAVGRSSRSNPATYTGAFDYIRKEFGSATRKSPALFSFNSKGSCGTCKGRGSISMNMFFLPDATIPCDECQGRRYPADVLRHKLRGKSIADVLDMTIEEAAGFFSKNKQIVSRLGVMLDVGLGYLTLGQSLSSLSGGECQRVKLANGLAEGANASCFVLDEPTSGLHHQDVAKLMDTLHRLVDTGHSVIVIEHNLEVIRQADWVIDMGPGPGRYGGNVLVAGPPEAVAACSESLTGQALLPYVTTG